MNKKEPVLVKFRASENFINIRTISRQRKSTQSFDFHRWAFTDLEAEGHITVKDGYSVADFRLIDDGAMVQIDFTWLSKYGDNTVKGFDQTVTLKYDALADAIWNSLAGNNGPKQWSMLSIDRAMERPRLDFGSPGAQQTIRDVLAVPVLRHKLTRAVRDNFHWSRNGSGHIVKFYADFDRYSFTFQEFLRDGVPGICGGLILHHHDGLAKAKYEVHT